MVSVIKSTDELHKLKELLNEEQHLTNGIKLTQYADNELNELAYYVTFLECNIDRLTELGLYSCLDILYSRYYWFTKLLVQYESIYCKDEGMSQQQFKIIEAIDYAVAEMDMKIDSGLLESIEKELGYCSIE